MQSAAAAGEACKTDVDTRGWKLLPSFHGSMP